jgi:hypothetical protein
MIRVARPEAVLVALAGAAATSAGAATVVGGAVCADAAPAAKTRKRAGRIRMPHFTCGILPAVPSGVIAPTCGLVLAES